MSPKDVASRPNGVLLLFWGKDRASANTIIIDRADRFGLSDLYQLRGRVGRYKHQAYAYLLLPRHAGLLVEARKRISAIKQYSTLGSGFRIAMRDLEIRGAGNLLGAEQSGHIAAVGFELYCQLLRQSVSNLKGEKIKPRARSGTSPRFPRPFPRRTSPAPRNRPLPSPPPTSKSPAKSPPGLTGTTAKAKFGNPQSAIRNPQFPTPPPPFPPPTLPSPGIALTSTANWPKPPIRAPCAT